MSKAMARPPFHPDQEQAATLRAIARQAQRVAEAEDQLSALMARARSEAIPVDQIATAARIAMKTVYNRLGRSADTDQGIRSSR